MCVCGFDVYVTLGPCGVVDQDSIREVMLLSDHSMFLGKKAEL